MATDEMNALPLSSTLTPADAALRIGCSLSMVYKLIRNGTLKARPVGKRYRVYLASVGDYLTLPAVPPADAKRAGGTAKPPRRPVGKRPASRRPVPTLPLASRRGS